MLTYAMALNLLRRFCRRNYSTKLNIMYMLYIWSSWRLYFSSFKSVASLSACKPSNPSGLSPLRVLVMRKMKRACRAGNQADIPSFRKQITGYVYVISYILRDRSRTFDQLTSTFHVLSSANAPVHRTPSIWIKLPTNSTSGTATRILLHKILSLRSNLVKISSEFPKLNFREYTKMYGNITNVLQSRAVRDFQTRSANWN